MATPHVPPRPARSQHPASPSTVDATLTAPRIPPRPAGRRRDQSHSPDRYAPSPLNELPRRPSSTALYSSMKNNQSSSSIDTPQRPPSVNLPSLGQEGNEYGELNLQQHQNAPVSLLERPAQTSHIHSELPLHAPKPSLAKSSARAQVAVVTRTDSNQAAAMGIGIRSESSPRDDHDPHHRPLKSKTSSGVIRSGSSLSTERPGSASQVDAHGIPHIGQHVPMLPNAGDVQAPSPALGNPAPAGDAGEGSRQRYHNRKHSGNAFFNGVPKDCYGIRGHGTQPGGILEQNWRAKHSEEFSREQSHYSPALPENRPEWAYSSDDLNKSVRATAKFAGSGSVSNVIGVPDEQIAYTATEEYLKHTQSHSFAHRRSSSQSHVESPLRKMAFSQDATDPRASKATDVTSPSPTLESDDRRTIHVPEHLAHTMARDRFDIHESHRHRQANSDFDAFSAEERGYSTPILASDETQPDFEQKAAAVPPHDRHSNFHPEEFGLSYRHSSHPGSGGSSRAGSRPSSIHAIPAITKWSTYDDHELRHTPLENVDEHTLLELRENKDALKMKRQKEYPYDDIWESAPDSLQYTTEVNSPEPPRETVSPENSASQTTTVEILDENAIQKDNHGHHIVKLSPNEILVQNKAGIDKRIVAHVAKKIPDDAWEDAPDYAMLTATVEQMLEDESSTGITVDGVTSHPPTADIAQTVTPLAGSIKHPPVPPRPQKKEPSVESVESVTEPATGTLEPRKAPAVPDRPKPGTPRRPVKSASRDSNDNANLTETVSAGSTGSFEDDAHKTQKPAPPPIKSKPIIPTRPAGGKIAALQAGFMADLNSRLKIGPRIEPSQPQHLEESQNEKLPLQDARKGRARGPSRRKPGVATTLAPQLSAPTGFASQSVFAPIWTVWHSGKNGSIIVPGSHASSNTSPEPIHQVDISGSENLSRKSTTAIDTVSLPVTHTANDESIRAAATNTAENVSQSSGENPTDSVDQVDLSLTEEPESMSMPKKDRPTAMELSESEPHLPEHSLDISSDIANTQSELSKSEVITQESQDDSSAEKTTSTPTATKTL